VWEDLPKLQQWLLVFKRRRQKFENRYRKKEGGIA
jgi:hypothetical protein